MFQRIIEKSNKKKQKKTLKQLKSYFKKSHKLVSNVECHTKRILSTYGNDIFFKESIIKHLLLNYNSTAFSSILYHIFDNNLVDYNYNFNVFDNDLSNFIMNFNDKDLCELFMPECFFIKTSFIDKKLFKLDFWKLPIKKHNGYENILRINNQFYFLSLHIQHLSFFLQYLARDKNLKSSYILVNKPFNFKYNEVGCYNHNEIELPNNI